MNPPDMAAIIPGLSHTSQRDVRAVAILRLPIEAGGTDAHLSHRYWTGAWPGGRVGSAGAVRRLTAT